VTAAAVEHARRLLGLIDRLGKDPFGSQPEHHADIWDKARIELTVNEWTGKGNLSSDVQEHLRRLVNEPPRGPVTTRNRDELLAYVVKDICEWHDIKPTRNRSNHGKRENLSGCAIVATVLNEMGRTISEASVEKAYEKY
jgi:hypothetical protein